MTADDISNHSLRWFNVPAIVSIIIAIVGQMFVSIWWAAGESARITATTEAVKRLENNVISLNTPLSVRVITLEKRVEDFINEYVKRIDQIDQQGTRALATIISNQQRISGTLDRLGERVLLQDKRISEIEGRAVYQIQSQIDVINTNIKRVDEISQQTKRLLDAQNAALSEFFKRYDASGVRRPRLQSNEPKPELD